jgi:uncharacterized repeat protein (TIGR02543 family)
VAANTYPLTLTIDGVTSASFNLVVGIAVPNTLTGTATISNANPKIGDTLTGSLVGGNNTGTLTHQWKVNGVNAGTGPTYTVQTADLGKTITLEITSSVETGTLTSAATAAVVKKTAPSAPAAPTIASKTHNSVTLTANALYEFSMDGTTWQASNVFSGLTPSTAYTFYQRIAETADTEASAASAVLNETTDAAPATVTDVSVSPATADIQQGGSQQFAATVTGTNNPATTVTWSIESGAEGSTGISTSGLLTVDAAQTSGSAIVVRATSAADTSKYSEATVTVTSAPPAPTYGISLSASGTHTFPAATAGYGAQTPLSVAVTNTGNQATGALTIAISATGAFDLSATAIPSLTTTTDANFTVTPKTGLTANTYTATVTVSGASVTSQSFDVNFTVNAAPITDTTPPTGEITLGTHGWNNFWNTVTFGLFAKNTQTVTITGTDAGGTVTIEYYLAPTELTQMEAEAITSWDAYASALTIQPGKYIIYAKLTDPSNNVTIINSGGVVVYQDSAQGTAAISFTKGSTADVNATVLPNGNTIAKIMNGANTLAAGADYTVDNSTGVITFKAAYFDSLAASATPYTLTVYYNPQGVEYPASPLAGSVAPATTAIALTVSAPGTTTYTVTWNGNGGTASEASRQVNAGAAVGTLPTATRSGSYSFDGWFTAASGGTQITAAATVSGNVTYYAHWTYTGGSGGSGGNGGNNSGGTTPPTTTVPPTTPPTTNPGGHDVTTPADKPPVANTDGSTTLPGGGTVTSPGGVVVDVPPGTVIGSDGSLSFPQGSGGGSITHDSGHSFDIHEDAVIVFDEDTPLGYYVLFDNPFTDVKDGAWYYDDVIFAYTHGLMVGTNDHPMTFSPNNSTTRAMIVTVLYRIAGRPGVSGANSFSDVKDGTWYTDAVNWAAAKKIVSGIGGGKFDPEAPITRQDLAVILDNYAKAMGLKLPTTRAYPGFRDDADIANYALEAIKRFFAAGIIEGKDGNRFDSKGQATRAEVAAMLHRFIETVEKENPNANPDTGADAGVPTAGK